MARAFAAGGLAPRRTGHLRSRRAGVALDVVLGVIVVGLTAFILGLGGVTLPILLTGIQHFFAGG